MNIHSVVIGITILAIAFGAFYGAGYNSGKRHAEVSVASGQTVCVLLTKNDLKTEWKCTRERTK